MIRARAQALASLPIAFLLHAGCVREAPDVREVRKATEEYVGALVKNDVNAVAERSTCVVGAGTLVGGTVLRIEPPRAVSMGTLDSLAKAYRATQRTIDSLWAHADETTADSLFTVGRALSIRSSVFRNAVRAAQISLPGTVVDRDSPLETRAVRARFRYSGAVIGPKAVDKEMIVRLLRIPGGKWIVFSVYLPPEDPGLEMI